MGIHRPPTVKDQPSVNLVNWTVFEISNGDRHIAGFHLKSNGGRVSSKIVERLNTRQFKTRSDRVYNLLGDCAYDNEMGSDTSYVWCIWCQGNNIDITLVKNVSQEYV